MVTYAQVSPKMVNPRDIAGERRRRRRRRIYPFQITIDYLQCHDIISITTNRAVTLTSMSSMYVCYGSITVQKHKRYKLARSLIRRSMWQSGFVSISDKDYLKIQATNKDRELISHWQGVILVCHHHTSCFTTHMVKNTVFYNFSHKT